jgi:acyl-CoA synthetase (NDP forming)
LTIGGGKVSLVCQSGGNVRTILNLGNKIGVSFSKTISYGNACDLDSTDFIEYFGEDPETKIIIGYIEGIKDGRRFLEVSKKVGKNKPIIILRGGVTSGGSKAVTSHTGSLAGSNEVWNAVFKYTGAIKVQDIEELLGTALAFLHLPKLEGRKAGIVGLGGGTSVLGVDECEKAGLSVPNFTSGTILSLSEFIPPINTSVKNPVDPAESVIFDPSIFGKAVEIAALDSQIDVLVLVYHNMSGFPGLLKRVEEIITNMNIPKPVVAVLEPAINIEEVQSKHLEKKIPVYNNLTYAAKAIYNVASYYEQRETMSKEMRTYESTTEQFLLQTGDI